MKPRQKHWIAPSLLSADFSRLKDEIKSVEKAKADWLHLDVMDGHFVPNITIGPLVVSAIRPVTKMTLDCHLMVSEPEKWVEPFLKAGADVVTIHAEVTKDLSGLLAQIRKGGAKAGVSVNPATPLAMIEHVLDQVDLVLIMSVNPGFGGQKFIESSLPKIQQLKQMRGSRKFLIEVDGGVNADNIQALAQAGAEVFVAGNAIFGQKNRAKAITTMRKKLK